MVAAAGVDWPRRAAVLIARPASEASAAISVVPFVVKSDSLGVVAMAAASFALSVELVSALLSVVPVDIEAPPVVVAPPPVVAPP